MKKTKIEEIKIEINKNLQSRPEFEFTNLNTILSDDINARILGKKKRYITAPQT